MYQARLHPEQYVTQIPFILVINLLSHLRYSNTFTDEQVKKLHDAIMYVCDTAVGTLADSDKFPKDWLMKYRWSKGKKETPKLPNGSKITFLKVGGRTSAIVPSVQKKTAAVAGDVSDGADDQSEGEAKPKKTAKRKSKAQSKEEGSDDANQEEEVKPKKAAKRKSKVKQEEEDGDEVTQEEEVKPKKTAKRKSKAKQKEEDVDEVTQEEVDEEMPAEKKQKRGAKGTARKGRKADETVESDDIGSRRRSGRLSQR
jgi:formamidopyrimidine-DNA glycosylase